MPWTGRSLAFASRAAVACVACLVLAACDIFEPPPEPPAPPVARQPEPVVSGRPPKPGERIRQRELDGYCSQEERPLAFYYHGGRPVERLARRDGCYPLFLADCGDSIEQCYAQADQEPGMWCCQDPAQSQQASR